MLWDIKLVLLCRLFPRPVEQAVLQIFPGGHTGASVWIWPGSLTWRLVSFDALVLEGHGLCQCMLGELFLGLVGGVVT